MVEVSPYTFRHEKFNVSAALCFSVVVICLRLCDIILFFVVQTWLMMLKFLAVDKEINKP